MPHSELLGLQMLEPRGITATLLDAAKGLFSFLLKTR